MKTLLKIAAVLAGLFILALGAAAIAIKIYLPPEKLKALAISSADSALHRKLEVRTVDIGILTGLRIEGLRLSETPDFSKGEFLKADAFILKPEWLPLLHKEIVARQIVLQGVSANVTKDKAGNFNFSDLLAKPPSAAPASEKPAPKTPAEKKTAKSAPTPASAAAAAPLALAVNSLRVEDAQLHYTDQQQGAKADVKVNSVAVDGFSLSGPFTVAVDVQADYSAKGKSYAGTFKAKGTADLGGGDPAGVKADFTSFSAGTLGKEITGTLKFENAKSPKVAVTLDVPALDDKFINAAAGSAVAPAGTSLPAVKAELQAAYSEPALDVSSFKVSAAGVEFSGSASVADVNAKDPKLKLEAGTNEFKLAPLFDILPQLAGKGLDGTASLKLSVKGTEQSPEVSEFRFSLALDPLTSATLKKLAPAAGVPDGLQLPKITLAIAGSGNKDIFTLKQLEFQMADLDAKASGTVGALQSKAKTFNLKFETNKFQLASLAADADSMKQFGLGGTVSLTAAASGTAAAPKASGALALSDIAAKYQGQTLQKVSGQLQFTQDSVNMPQLTGNLNGGDFKLKIAAANPAAPTLTLSGWMSVLDLGTLQKLAAASGGANPAKKAQPAAAQNAPAGSAAQAKKTAAANNVPILKTSGDITVDKTTHPNFNCGKMTLTWNLTGVTPDMKRLNGTAKLLVGPGATTNILDFADQQGGLVRAMVLPLEAMQKARGLHIPGFNPPDMQNIPFNKIQGDYTAKNGVVSMQPFLLDSPTITMNTAGTADMCQQTANLKTQTKSALGEIDLTITGPFSNLSIRPNLSQQAQSTAKQLLQNQGKALLKQFFH